MSDDDHKCHCHHVVVLVTDHRRMSWAIGSLFLLLLAFAFKEIVAAERSHIREDAPRGRQGERMGPDRVDEPTR